MPAANASRLTMACVSFGRWKTGNADLPVELVLGAAVDRAVVDQVVAELVRAAAMIAVASRSAGPASRSRASTPARRSRRRQLITVGRPLATHRLLRWPSVKRSGITDFGAPAAGHRRSKLEVCCTLG